VPAKARGKAGALGDEGVAVVDQELQLPGCLVVACVMELGFLAQRRAGDRQGVDRVGLAAGAGALAGAGHELRADPQHRLAAGHQEALQAAVDVAAVLQGEADLGPEAVGPGHQLALARLVGSDGDLG
jgi:hypothetical protein